MKIGDKIKYIGYNQSVFTTDAIYTVLGLDADGDPIIINDEGLQASEYFDRFEIVESKYSFEQALEFVGKTVQYDGKSFSIEAVTVLNKFYPSYNSFVQNEIETQGYSIVLETEDDHIPVNDLDKVDMTVELNDEYSAKIEGENVIVGCQTIPIQKVMEIVEKYNKFK